MAHAIVEYLYREVGARCLFATHYHELTQLQDELPGIASYYAASTRTEQGIVFLYKIIRGVADGSFGIEVAKLADLPAAIIDRADDILHHVMQRGAGEQLLPAAAEPSDARRAELVRLRAQVQELQAQLAQYEQQSQALRTLDYDNLSPRQAFDLLWSLKEQQA